MLHSLILGCRAVRVVMQGTVDGSACGSFTQELLMPLQGTTSFLQTC